MPVLGDDCASLNDSFPEWRIRRAVRESFDFRELERCIGEEDEEGRRINGGDAILDRGSLFVEE